MRAFDWSATSLGTPDGWPSSLKAAVRVMLTSRFAMWMAAGPDLIFFCNDAYLPTTGNKRDWVLGARSDKVWAEIWPDIGPRIERVLRTGEATWDEALLLYLERSGFTEESYHTFSYSPLDDDNGVPNGMLCVVAEVTEKIIGERQLAMLRDLGTRLAAAATRAEVLRAFEASLATEARDLPFVLVYLIDSTTNKAQLGTLHGLARHNPLAENEIDPQGQDGFWPVRSVLEGDANVVEVARENLGDFHLECWQIPPAQAFVLPLQGSNSSKPAGFLVAGLNPHRVFDNGYRGFIEIVAAQLAAAIARADEYERERARAEGLAEIDRAKTVFFSNVSHEFRTPLTLMLGPLEDLLARSEILPAEVADQLVLARRNGLRLLRLVNGLLDFSRIEAGQAEVNYQAVDLPAVTAELASNFRSACEQAGLSLQVTSAPLSLPIYVDLEMWERIVLNLLSNAFKFTLRGEISVDIRQAGEMAVLTVRDTGTGISPSELPKLFERFHRVSGAKGRSIEGTGIGLALVQELVKLHGGAIEAESVEGVGSIFRVRVPTGTAHLPAGQIRTESRQTPAATRAQIFVDEALRWLPDAQESVQNPSLLDIHQVDAAPAHAPEAARILLADDNADLRSYVGGLLRNRGYAVEAVSDGQAALTAARRSRPDLILTDVMMPELDGFGLLAAIRADPALSAVPVVMLSARAGEEAQIEGLAADADDYLAKPFSARELLARVRANLSLTQLRRESVQAVAESEMRFRAAVQAVEGIVWTNNAAGEMHGEQPGWAALTGQTHDQYQGHGWARAVHPEDAQPTMDAWKDAVAQHRPFVFEHRVRRHDGVWRIFSVRAIPLISENGSVQQWVGVHTDITARLETEAALRTSEARLKAIFETVPVGIVIAEAPSGRIIDGNRQIEAILGHKIIFSPDVDSYGAWVSHHADGRQVDPHEYPLARAVAGEERPELEVCYQRGDGTPRWVKFIGAPIRDADGQITGGIVATLDIHRETLALKALDRTREELEARVEDAVRDREAAQARLAHAQRMEALGQLAGGIAHDFNNVLQAVSGGLRLIQRRAGNPEEIQNITRMVIDATSRGASVTARLLTFARKGELRAVAVPISGLLENLREILTSTLGGNIEIQIDTIAGELVLQADKAQLETVLINLAVNARDAMPDGGTLTLTARAETVMDAATHQAGLKPGAYIRLDLADSGIGMDAATLARAAEPFFTTKGPGRGTGLGLAMARGFAQQSEGGLSITSKVGAGTIVTLWFPEANIAETYTGTTDIAPAEAPKRSARVLVVDDDQMVREVLVRELQDLGYDTMQASEGLAALALLDRGEKIDLLITDLSMPGMNGVVLTKEARHRLASLPVILLTGYADTNLTFDFEIMQSEGVKLLRKPIVGPDLMRHATVLLTAGGR